MEDPCHPNYPSELKATVGPRNMIHSFRDGRGRSHCAVDSYEKYDMTFNGAASTRVLSSSPGKYSGEDNAWALSLLEPVIIDFDKTVMKYPSIKRSPGGASSDLIPNLQNPENPLPLLTAAVH